MKNIELDYTEKLFRQWIHRMAFCAFMLCCFNVTKIPLHRELFPSCHDVVVAVVVRRVEVGWEGGSADGSERHGRNPRLKLMC